MYDETFISAIIQHTFSLACELKMSVVCGILDCPRKASACAGDLNAFADNNFEAFLS